MSSYKNLMAQALRSFPTLYSEPLDVAVQMLGNGGNYAWGKNGELRLTYNDEQNQGLEMTFKDLDEDQVGMDEEAAKPIDCLRSLYASRQLSLTAERQRRTLVEENMKTIVEGKCTESYFRQDYQFGPQVRKMVQATQTFDQDTRFLYFPDNITPEWGEVLGDFHSWLEVRLNMEFGVSVSGANHHWPEHAQLLSQKIKLAREILHPLLHDGESYEVHAKRMSDMSSRIIDEILAEEKTADPNVLPTPAARRPRI